MIEFINGLFELLKRYEYECEYEDEYSAGPCENTGFH